MSNLIDRTLKFFFEEAEEHLEVLETGLLRLEKDPRLPGETAEELFRSAHTLKGAAGLVKQNGISQIAHRLEDALEGLQQGGRLPAPIKVDHLFIVLDCIRQLLQAAANGEPEPEDVLSKAKQLLPSPAVEEALPKQVQSAECRSEESISRPNGPAPSAQAVTNDPPSPAGVGHPKGQVQTGGGSVKVGTDQLEAMMSIVGEITVTQNHLGKQIESLGRMRREIDFAEHRILNEVSNFSERYAYALPEQIKYTDELISEFQELEFDRYDELALFTRKLQEITHDINEAMGSVSGFFGQFAGEIEKMDGMIKSLKERISVARTVQVGELFQRFTRSIRDLARSTGKELQLTVAGGDTLIDRVVFDGLYPPLLHILRNAAAHGIEPPVERRLSGKPETGTICLTAEQKGNTVEITVRDDGRGMQLDKIRSRAEEKGFLQPGEQIEEQDLLQMVFRHGFSTSDTADDHSGRGIGMSVVMDRLAALNGTIDLSSQQGQGTTVRLTLPLSLIIINVIQFRLGPQGFIIPTNLVMEILDLPPSDTVPTKVAYHDEQIPAVNLNEVLGIPRFESKRHFAIVTHLAGKPVALLVEEILSQEDTIIRPFGPFLHHLPHLAGTSIAGDGTLRYVLNPSRILLGEPSVQDQPAAATYPVQTMRPRVLVVDDSLSVRKHAGLILENNGIDVLTATNGLEALEILDETEVSFILTDLEMPLMHGYQLLGELGRSDALKAIPAAVLSSRASRPHQEKALHLGACAYIVKPFDEESLMPVIWKHLGDTVKPASF